ncbi:hypothetical protein ACFWFZ_26475 [Streptomyces sp. NPDC060232]|uniref:hypothetical protein n=1 Tax=Streptomyces sp. NPDC060232 TaxID=3347079 RepID=UPI003665AF13
MRELTSSKLSTPVHTGLTMLITASARLVPVAPGVCPSGRAGNGRRRRGGDRVWAAPEG